jgi:WD40 repeat protein
MGPHGGPVRRVLYSSDGSTLITAERDRPVRMWSVTEQRLIGSLAHGDTLRGLAPHPRAPVLFGAGAGGVWRWDLTTLERQLIAGQPALEARELAVSGDGTRLVTGTVEGHLFIWDVATGTRQVELRFAHDGLINSVGWNRFRPLIASGGQDGVAQVRSAHDGAPIDVIQTDRDQVRDALWSPNGQLLAIVIGDTNYPGIWIWDAEAARVVLSIGTRYAWPDAVAWSPDSMHLAVARDQDIEIWRATDGQTWKLAEAARGDIDSIAWSRDGRFIAYGDRDGWVSLVPWVER